MTAIRVLSIWQPFASLAIKGHKLNETRSFAPPSTLKVGERFAIASTKQIKSVQALCADHPRMLHHCNDVSLPPWRELPRGCILGTVQLGNPFQITREYVGTLIDQEYWFGDWTAGRWAWPMLDPIEFATPIPVRGGQGVWIYDGELPE